MEGMKFIVALAFLGIFASLASALVFMMRNGAQGQSPKSGRMVKALGIRVGLSILLFICVLIGWHLGYLQPTGIAPGQ
jgi:formate hydrogenlyase subunit 3/multisubunit Na+/H+ antiporter MnhD subunit